MPTIDLLIETKVSRSIRARQLEAIFDVPAQEKARIHFKGEMPIEDKPWNVGLIVGPSGCGKSSILRNVFGATPELQWRGASVLDDFPKAMTTQAIAEVCSAVGFNTIPAWLRPYAVLSNGERFRVELARRLAESEGLVVMDEFTSVVDRQVAKIGSHAVQKHVRRSKQRFVAASCHYDIVEWLQPDWTFEPATMRFDWRSLRRRPELKCEIARVPREAWRQFAPFHYLSAQLHPGAKCFGLAVEGRLAAFVGVLHRPHARIRGMWGVSRLVTLPDYQGLGLAFALCDHVASMFTALGRRFRMYPAHPALVRGFDKSPAWRLAKAPGTFSKSRRTSTKSTLPSSDNYGGRACAVFEYMGAKHPDRALASALVLDPM